MLQTKGNTVAATPGQVVIVTGKDDKLTLEMHFKKRKKKDNRLEAPTQNHQPPLTPDAIQASHDREGTMQQKKKGMHD